MSAMDDAYALVIGIADYRHVTGLPSAVRNDARDVRDLLVDPRHCGYPPGHVTLLLDGEATRAAILGALSGLAARTDPASVLLVYISSHGGRLVSGAFAGEYLLPVDTVPASDEDLARTAISGAEFTAALKAIPARKALVIFDCCHAGGIGQPKQFCTWIGRRLPKDHRWTAKGGHPQQAEVTVTKGYGTVKAARPRSQNVQVGPKYFATGKVVTVHGAVRMTYNLHGSFNPPPGVVVH